MNPNAAPGNKDVDGIISNNKATTSVNTSESESHSSTRRQHHSRRASAASTLSLSRPPRWRTKSMMIKAGSEGIVSRVSVGNNDHNADNGNVNRMNREEDEDMRSVRSLRLVMEEGGSLTSPGSNASRGWFGSLGRAGGRNIAASSNSNSNGDDSTPPPPPASIDTQTAPVPGIAPSHSLDEVVPPPPFTPALGSAVSVSIPSPPLDPPLAPVVVGLNLAAAAASPSPSQQEGGIAFPSSDALISDTPPPPPSLEPTDSTSTISPPDAPRARLASLNPSVSRYSLSGLGGGFGFFGFVKSTCTFFSFVYC